MIYRDKSNRPHVQPPQWDFIPQELKRIPNWVLWTYDWVDSQWTKPPYQPGGDKASHSDPNTWNSYSVIKGNWYVLNGIQIDSVGIGWVITKESGIVGIDIDNCVTWGSSLMEEGQPMFDDWALAIINKLGDVYIEFSPSRTGLHILVRACISQSIKYSKAGVEIYNDARYFTITGDAWNAGPIAERQREIDEICGKLIALRESERKSGVNGLIQETVENLKEEIATRDVRPSDVHQFIGGIEEYKRVNFGGAMSIDERLRIAFQSENGLNIQKLFNGDCSDYADSSEDEVDRSAADMALCRYLAFYSDGSVALLAEMMRQSGLIRPKWERKMNSGQTYLEYTIDRALSTESNFYTAPKMISSPIAPSGVSGERRNRYTLTELKDAAIEYRKRSDIHGLKCGWSNLDRIYRPRQGMLSIWTGEPGAGKSTFILAYLYRFCMAYGLRLGLCSFELNPPERVLLELACIHLQGNVFDQTFDDDQLSTGIDELKNFATVFAPSWKQRDAEGLIGILAKEIEERGCDVFYLDPFTELQPKERLLGKYTDFASQELSKLKDITERWNIMTHLVCHPTKNFNRAEGVRLWNINGSGDFERKADFGLVVTRQNNTTIVHLQKRRDRLTGIEDAKAAFELNTDAYYFKETSVPIVLSGSKKSEEQTVQF